MKVYHSIKPSILATYLPYSVPLLGTKDLKYPQAVPCLAPAALYGEVSAEVVNMLRFTGTPTTHFDSKFGYVRDLTP